ncbi:MAG: hypothetical protein FJ098_09100, partial [Deltaproteobacteria bacterium]|nr:hypothetical protein [Deltaproteobacteria bacterium]
GVCLETRGETLAALERYDEAVALAPELRTARLDRALLLARLGRMAEARTELDLLAGVAPGNPVVRLVAGMLAAAEGDRDAVARCREELGVLAPAYAAWLDEGVRE